MASDGDGRQTFSTQDKMKIFALAAAGVAVVGGIVYYMTRSKEPKVVSSSPRELRVPEIQSSPHHTKLKVEQQASEPYSQEIAISAESEKSVSYSQETEVQDGGCSRETLIAMFKVILQGMEATINKLAIREAKLREEDPDMEDSVILELLNKEYLEEILEVQKEAFERFNTTEEKASVAVALYQDDPEFNQVLEKMNRIRQILEGGQVDEEQLKKIPASLTVDRVIELFTEMIEGMIEARQACFDELQERNGVPPTMLDVEERYREVLPDVKRRTLAKFEVEEEVLDVAMLAYGQEKDLNSQMLVLQKRQRDAFAGLCLRCQDGQDVQDSTITQ